MGRNIPKFNDNRFVSRKYRRKLRLSSYTSQIERVYTETAEDIPKQHETDEEKTHLSLIPLSRSPLLLSSSNPLINRNDCTILIRCLELLQEDGENTSFTINSLKEKGIWKASDQNDSSHKDVMRNGQRILKQVRDSINSLTDCDEDNDEIMLPRILAPQSGVKDRHC